MASRQAPEAVVVANATAGGGAQVPRLQAWVADAEAVDLCTTHTLKEARACVRAHWERGVRRFVAAGGDGTVHCLLNALHAVGPLSSLEALGIVPVGTGNDLARTLRLPESLAEALDMAVYGAAHPVDAIDVVMADTRVLALNVCAGGFGGYIDKVVSGDPKSLLGPFAYVMGAARVLPRLRRYDTTLTLDGVPVRTDPLLNVVVANAQYAAGGLHVAPGADPCDGLLDVVTVRAGRAGAVAGVIAQVLGGDYTTHPLVDHYRARQVHIEAAPPMWFNADGELLSNEPVTFTVRPGSIPIVRPPEVEGEAMERDM